MRRRAHLSAAGRVLHDYSRRIFVLTEEANVTIGLMRDLRAGALRLAATDTPARSWVPRILGVFRARHPGVRVQLHVGNTRQVIERLLSREDDVAVIAGSPQHPQLVVEHIADDPLVVIVPRGHAWRARSAVSLQDVCGQALIVREHGSSTRQLLEPEFSRKLLRPQVVMELGSHDAIIGAVEHGVGISILPLSLVRRDVERKAVGALPVRPVRLRHAVCLVYHVERAAFPLTRRLIEITHGLHGRRSFDRSSRPAKRRADGP